MVKTHPLSTPIIVKSFDVSKDPFQPHEMINNFLELKHHILVQLEALMQLANNIQLYITFIVSLLARFRSSQNEDTRMTLIIYLDVQVTINMNFYNSN